MVLFLGALQTQLGIDFRAEEVNSLSLKERRNSWEIHSRDLSLIDLNSKMKVTWNGVNDTITNQRDVFCESFWYVSKTYQFST